MVSKNDYIIKINQHVDLHPIPSGLRPNPHTVASWGVVIGEDNIFPIVVFSYPFFVITLERQETTYHGVVSTFTCDIAFRGIITEMTIHFACVFEDIGTQVEIMAAYIIKKKKVLVQKAKGW